MIDTAHYHRRTEGSITIFLALVILIVTSVVMVSIENARIQSAYVRGSEITYMALDSCFSAYGREIFEDYGLMMLWQSEEEILSNYNTYVDKNSNFRQDKSYLTVDILALKNSNSEITEVKMATDDAGELIEQQIYEYMKSALTEDMISEILMNSESLSQSKGINEFNEMMDNCSEYLSNVEDSIEEIYDNINVIKEKDNPKELLQNMKEKLEEIKKLSAEGDNAAVRNDLYKQYRNELNKYQTWEEDVNSATLEILNATNEYLVNTTVANEEIDVINSKLSVSQDKYSREIYDVMMEQLEEVNEQILSIDNDNYNVMNNKQNTIQQRKIMNLVKENMSQTIAKAIEIDSSNRYISDCDNYDDIINSMYLDVSQALVNIEAYNEESMYVNYTKSEEKKQKNEIVDFVEGIKKNGVINYVIAGNVSDKKISDKEMPSRNMDNISSDSWKKYSPYDESVRRALTGQYILDKFLMYTDNEEGVGANYEVEYIIEGRDSDKDNITQIINRLIAIREGFNLIYLMKDTEKKNEAYAMAAAIVGFTGMPVIIRLTQMLILGAWAYAESIVDVKDLLEGYRVNVIKNKEEWNLSLSGIRTLSSSEDNRENRKGLTYEDYLRYMLFSQDRCEQIYRIMDMIQINLCRKYNNDFRMSDCILKIGICTDYDIKRVFSDMGFIRNLINNSEKKFVIKIKREYGY